MTNPTQLRDGAVNVAQRGAQGSTRRPLIVGSSVRVERDEHRHRPRGTWKHYRGRSGTVVEINHAGKGAPEYGVGFGKSRRVEAWFKSFELASINQPEDDA